MFVDIFLMLSVECDCKVHGDNNDLTRLAVDKVKPCTGYGVGVVMQNKPSLF